MRSLVFEAILIAGGAALVGIAVLFAASRALPALRSAGLL